MIWFKHPWLGKLLSLAFLFICLLWLGSLLGSCSFQLYEEDESLMVEVLDVGQGDAILLSWGPFQAMVDVGAPGQGVWDSLAVRGIDTLDWVMVSHHHLDHFGALLEVLPPPLDSDELLHPGLGIDSLIYTSGPVIKKLYVSEDSTRSWGWTLLEAGVQRQASEPHPWIVDTLYTGKRLELPGPLRARVLWPDEGSTLSGNPASIVWELHLGTQRLLFTGDLEEEQELQLVEERRLISVDWLKVAHHGSRSSTSLDFLHQVKPHHKVLSYACDNSYGHPHQSTLNHLKLYSQIEDLEVHSTCRDGTVRFMVNERGVFRVR